MPWEEFCCLSRASQYIMVPPTVGWRRESQRVDRSEGEVNVSRDRHVFSSLQSCPALHDCWALKSSQALALTLLARILLVQKRFFLTSTKMWDWKRTESLHTLLCLCCVHSVIHLHTHLIKRKRRQSWYAFNYTNITIKQKHRLMKLTLLILLIGVVSASKLCGKRYKLFCNHNNLYLSYVSSRFSFLWSPRSYQRRGGRGPRKHGGRHGERDSFLEGTKKWQKQHTQKQKS